MEPTAIEIATCDNWNKCKLPDMLFTTRYFNSVTKPAPKTKVPGLQRIRMIRGFGRFGYQKPAEKDQAQQLLDLMNAGNTEFRKTIVTGGAPGVERLVLDAVERVNRDVPEDQPNRIEVIGWGNIGGDPSEEEAKIRGIMPVQKLASKYKLGVLVGEPYTEVPFNCASADVVIWVGQVGTPKWDAQHYGCKVAQCMTTEVTDDALNPAPQLLDMMNMDPGARVLYITGDAKVSPELERAIEYAVFQWGML